MSLSIAAATLASLKFLAPCRPDLSSTCCCCVGLRRLQFFFPGFSFYGDDDSYDSDEDDYFDESESEDEGPSPEELSRRLERGQVSRVLFSTPTQCMPSPNPLKHRGERGEQVNEDCGPFPWHLVHACSDPNGRVGQVHFQGDIQGR
jgi:hypothetical protein